MIRIFLIFAVASLVALRSGAVAAGQARPNIAVFLADDHSMLDSSAYGSCDVRTPSMERIAAAGMTFTHAFVASPSCAPSRASLLTGLMPVRHGAEPNHAKPRDEIKKWPAYFQELGYEVVAFGKVGHYEQTRLYGFDHFEHITFHDDVAVAEGAKWLRARKSDKPLCIFFGTNWPHVPWPATGEGYTADAVHLPPTLPDTPAMRAAMATYYAAVARMDADLGLALDAIRDALGQETLIVATADHGTQLPFGKWNLYDAGTRVPLIASWPGKIAPASHTDAMVSWIDLLPTLLELAGGTPPAGIDGQSFAGVLRGEKTTHRERIFTTHSGDGKNNNVYPMRSVRTADWKYIRNLHPEYYYFTHLDWSQKRNDYFESWKTLATTDAHAAALLSRYHQRPVEELYDLRADPLEQQNLSADPAQAGRLTALRAEVNAWMKANGDTGKTYGNPRLLTDPDRDASPKAEK